MSAQRPDPVVKFLTFIATLATGAVWLTAPVVLLGVPVAKLFWGGVPSNFQYGFPVRVSVPGLEVPTIWGPVPLELKNVDGVLQVPIATLPWPVLSVLWAYAAAGLILLLLFVNNLRRIFKRVRDGAAFDAHNAARLSMMGAQLIGFAGLQSVAETITFFVVKRGATSALTVSMGLDFNWLLVLLGLVLISLAQVFRRGAELEHEQSLVV